MTTLVISYDADGQITDWRYDSDDDYSPDDDELVADTSEVDHRDLERMMVDVDEEELVEDPDYEPQPTPERNSDQLDELRDEEPLRRARITGDTKQVFRDARENEDLQTQLDVLFEIMTGEEP